MDDIKILICCHKQCELPQNDIYLPIQVGSSQSKCDLGIQRDDSIISMPCDNISTANNIYCEMTAMYWAWKNIRTLYPNIHYIGLCHYRRFFNMNQNKDGYKYYREKAKQVLKVLIGKNLHNAYYEPVEIINDLKSSPFLSSTDRLINAIPNNDIICTKEIIMFNTNIRNSFEIVGRIYIDSLDRIIKDFYKEYYNTYLNVLNGRKLSTANMIIIKEELLDEYCEFIFGALKKHVDLMQEDNVLVDPYREKAYSRVSGFLSELLTYVYIRKKEQDGVHCLRTKKFFVKQL